MAGPLTLTYDMVVKAARKAWAENRLQVQHEESEGCRYRDYAGRPCVVGAAIPDDVFAIANAACGGFNTMGVTQINYTQNLRDIIQIAPEDVSKLSSLQAMHDRATPSFENKSCLSMLKEALNVA